MRASRRRWNFAQPLLGLRRLAVLVGLAVVATVAVAQDQPAPPAPRGPAPPHPSNLGPPNPPTDRQGMWPSPTAEDWKKPVLIPFQRTWEDALAVSKETGKPILVCINMDGEIASEHFAGVRYRQPEIAKLYEPYVCVIASVYRHNARDYDDQGNRILCPRFGSVTCGEHIAIESILYEKFMEGKRVSPRHIAVGLDGKPLYDVYFINDTEHVFQAIREGIVGHEGNPTVVRGDRPIVERVASRDAEDRTAVETAYQNGDAAVRRSLLDAALAHPDAAPIDLVRLGLLGLDVDLGKLARQALAKSESPSATNLIADTLRVPMDVGERDALIAALARLGETSPRARWLATVHQGLAGDSSAVDVKGWAKAGGEYQAAPAQVVDEGALVDQRGNTDGASRAKPEDPVARLEFAEASLALAIESRKSSAGDPKSERMAARLAFDDARIAALHAQKLGAPAWRTNTVLALAAYYGGDVDEGYARAEAAVKEMPPGESGWNSMAVLTVFAESRWKAIKQAVRDKKNWTAQWLTDLNAANTILLRHPLGTDAQAVWHYDFLEWLSAVGQAARFLDEAVARFPDSATLHQRLRMRVLKEKGVDGLEPVYEAMLKDKSNAALESFAGYASVVVGDFRRRKGADDEATAAYDRAIAHYDHAKKLDPTRGDAADHAVALAMAGRARLALDRGDVERALADITASFERRPASAGIKDDVGVSPVDTGLALQAKLKELKRDDLSAKLDAALAKLDPVLLQPERE